MEKNNSKQVLFAIIGIAVLVVAVVGVSFAFFTYSRTGKTNNVITTGKLVFNFGGGEDGGDGGNVDPDTGKRTPADVVTSETEPKGDDEGKEQKPKSGVELGGQIPENVDAVNFAVYLIKGKVPEGQNQSKRNYEETDRMDPKFIKVYVEPDLNNSSENVKQTIQSTIEEKYSTGDLTLTDDITPEGGKIKIASGTLQNDNVERTYAYMFSMWISDELIKDQVSDTDANAKYRASATTSGVLPDGKTAEQDTRQVYGDLFYSVKIRIEAGDQVREG